MKKHLIIWSLIFLCSTTFAQIDADRAFINGKIYTADAEQSFAEAVAIKADTLVFVGSNAAVQEWIGTSTLVTDLEGKVILPGIHDIHIHLLEASSEAASMCTLDAWAWTTTELAEELVDCNPQPNSNGWILAWGHSIITLLESGENPREVLDLYFPNTPVVAMEETSHSGWVNSAALAELEIDADTPDPMGGLIVHEGGEPNGILLDSAADLAFAAALAPTPTIEGQNYEGLIEFGLPSLAGFGITSIVEGRTYWKRNYIETWQQVKDDGLLTARVVLAPWMHPEDDDEDLIPALTALYDEGDNMLKVTQLKCYIDGITLNGTAALDQPYVYNFGWPFNNGTNYFTPERLEDYITQLELIGFDFFIHSIGNRGAQESLDAIEGARTTNGDIGARHRITHLEIVNAIDYGRFAELDVIADMQVSGNWTNPNQWAWNEDYVGVALSQNYIPLKNIWDAGALVTLSSDWDVSSMNPFRGIENAVTRAPQELATVADAVDCRTINSAFAMRHDDITGSLEVGKLADLICINQDIFTIPQEQIGSTEVTLTMLGGEIIHSTDGFPQNISAVRQEESLTILPTVTRSWVTLSVVPEVDGMTIFTSTGEKVAVYTKGDLSEGSLRLDVSGWAEGVYLVSVTKSGIPQPTKRFVVYR
jgi:predicted amidohydrolase YtcJ